MGWLETLTNSLSAIGRGVSLATEGIIRKLSEFGIGVTAFQSQIITTLLFGLVIYLLITLLKKTRKLVKWSLIVLFVFLVISIIFAMVTNV